MRWTAPVSFCLLAAAATHADERTFSFECDAPPGHYSNWTMSTHAKAVTITGTLRINEIRQENRSLGVVNVYVKGGPEGKSAWGFRATDVDKAKALFLRLTKPGGHVDFGKKPLKAGDRKIPFRLELASSGALKARVGDDEHSTELGPVVPSKIEIGCSTGDFSFGDVRVVETN